MAAPTLTTTNPCIISFLLLLLAAAAATQTLDPQAAYLSAFKSAFSGTAMSLWDFSASPAGYCNFTGISCDTSGHVTSIDISSSAVVGTPPPNICAALPFLRSINLAFNTILGGFPAGLAACSALQELNLSHCYISGEIPDLSPLRSLRRIDLSYNRFTGAFPAASLFSLTGLELINFNENPGFHIWRLPESATQLTSLKVLVLSTSMLRGDIPPWLGNMTSLTDLELAGNYLTGHIPASLGRLTNLQLLELYYNYLEGEIPPELGNLTQLTDVDLSENKLSGSIPEALCALPHLSVLQLYTNNLTGPVPAVLGNSTALTILSIYRNHLTGPVPANLGARSELIVLELSENRFTGPLPAQACARSKLLYYLVLSNQFTGDIPAVYADCTSLLRFRVSNNSLSGVVPPGIYGLPHVSIIDIGDNRLEGEIAPAIGDAKNLTLFYAQNNAITGAIPPAITSIPGLIKIDLGNNRMTGPIPVEIGDLTRLNELSLAMNQLSGPIPESFVRLNQLNVLNLSHNRLSGPIPEALCSLLPNSLDFSNNDLAGPVPAQLINNGLLSSIAGNPGLCVTFRPNLTDNNPPFPLCPKMPGLGGRLTFLWMTITICTVASAAGVLLLVKKMFFDLRSADEAAGDTGMSVTPSSSLAASYDVTSFHKLSFGQAEIVASLTDKNIIGHGGSGTVYKITLESGELVAVKKLWTRRSKETSLGNGAPPPRLDRELRTEVEMLGSIRHKNIIKLYCCYAAADVNLLVYEYMPNGNLWDALHGDGMFLDWPVRRRVAIGVAQGLAYLHHDLRQPIVHRDIKTSNILLDADYEPKVADFGIAKVLQTRADHRGSDVSTTTIAGTHGYLAPEYAYSSKATTKCDVYSFGVVLMELATGRKPVEPDFGEGGNIIRWVTSKMNTKEEALETLDQGLAGSPFKDEIVKVLRVALRCTFPAPTMRPVMNEVVQLLIEAAPPQFDGKGSFQFKDSAPKEP